MQIVTWKKVIDAQTVSTTGSVNSDAIDASKLRAISYICIIDSGTSTSVGMVYQIINSDVEDAGLIAAPPGQEQNKSWITPASNGTLISSAGHTSGSTADGFAPVASKWIRFRVTGSGDNTSSVMTVWACCVEETSAVRG